MSTVRHESDTLKDVLHSKLESVATGSRFPLDSGVMHLQTITNRLSHVGDEALIALLGLFDVTSVSAAVAIKRLGGLAPGDTSGIRDALVDLWGRAEAARSLLFDVLAVHTGSARHERVADLWETARLLAPDAIATAMRLSEPVSQYVEFASKVIDHGGQSGIGNSLEIPRA